MSMPFSRPGAIDLSALKQRPPAPSAPAGPGAAGGGTPAGAAAYAVDVTEANFQALLEESMTAPVLLVVYSPSRMPESATLADELAGLVAEFGGTYLLGRVDIDAQVSIAQAMQIQAIPLLAMVLQGRMQPLFQDLPSLPEVRQVLEQLRQQLVTQGFTGKHQPLSGGVAAEATEEPEADPRYAAADDALMSGDIDAAIAEYDRLVKENPADVQAVIGLAQANLMKRTAHADLNTARAAAADAPDDVEAQILVADLDLLGGHVEDAFARLVDVVRRSAGEDRDRARLHLVELFTVVGDDPRVHKARQNLASALY